MIYKESVRPRISDFDRNGAFTNEAILQVLETAGSHHSDLAGDNLISSSLQGRAWIIMEWRVRVTRRPASRDTLNIATWTWGRLPSALVWRDFMVTDQDGGELFRAEAALALLDTARGRLTRIITELIEAYQPEGESVFEDVLPKPRFPDGSLRETAVPLRGSDMDFNGHIHNARYIELAAQAFPPDEVPPDSVSDIRIVYSGGIKEGESVTAKYARRDGAHCVALTSGGAVKAVIQMK
ncbi:MAG: hypothetical protein IKT23_04575 [Clostridia bacterium]|nr:hypothetical protein [Clostridia bacterium]